ncbi:MAG: signal peptidase I [Bacilli bacterium]
MKKANIYTTIIYIIIAFYICLSLLLFLPNFKTQYYNIINPIFWFILFIISFCIFKNDKLKKRYKYDYLQFVIISVIIYLIVFYLFGLITGYNLLPYRHDFIGIMKNIFSYVIIIFFQEYIRQILINRSSNKKVLLIIITGIFAIINIINLSYGMKLTAIEDIFKFSFTVIIAEIAKSMLLSYLTYKADYIPSLIYAISLQLIIYIIPITPDLNWFLEGTFKLLLPFLIFIMCNNFYIKKEKIISKRKKYIISLTPLLIIIIPIIILVSGVFKYQIIAVVSNSMVPVYSRGDAIIFEKLTEEEKEELKEGNIIIFRKNNTYILHRIESIELTPAGNRKYITKGDNNNGIDDGYITNEDIVGIYRLVIYKIGYPSVWLQESIE